MHASGGLLRVPRPLLGLLLPLLCVPCTAQTTPSTTTAPDITALQTRLTTLRDNFAQETRSAGLACSIPLPTLVIHHIPSFGNYNQDTNTLTTPDWTQLTPEETAVFFRIVGPDATPETARAEFETDAHHWIFVHELGHWTQACSHLKGLPPYTVELGANRISTAYWRTHDPALLPHMHAVFRGVVDHTPNPTPAGQEIEPYFNQHYQQLGPTPGYIWFQSHMCLAALEEAPAPTFAQALLRPNP